MTMGDILNGCVLPAVKNHYCYDPNEHYQTFHSRLYSSMGEGTLFYPSSLNHGYAIALKKRQASRPPMRHRHRWKKM